MDRMQALRGRIDAIDSELVKLFEARMAVVREIGDYKAANHLPILDAAREEAKLAAIGSLVEDPANEEPVRDLYRAIFAISRGAEKGSQT